MFTISPLVDPSTDILEPQAGFMLVIYAIEIILSTTIANANEGNSQL